MNLSTVFPLIRLWVSIDDYIKFLVQPSVMVRVFGFFVDLRLVAESRTDQVDFNILPNLCIEDI